MGGAQHYQNLAECCICGCVGFYVILLGEKKGESCEMGCKIWSREHLLNLEIIFPERQLDHNRELPYRAIRYKHDSVRHYINPYPL